MFGRSIVCSIVSSDQYLLVGGLVSSGVLRPSTLIIDRSVEYCLLSGESYLQPLPSLRLRISSFCMFARVLFWDMLTNFAKCFFMFSGLPRQITERGTIFPSSFGSPSAGSGLFSSIFGGKGCGLRRQLPQFVQYDRFSAILFQAVKSPHKRQSD